MHASLPRSWSFCRNQTEINITPIPSGQITAATTLCGNFPRRSPGSTAYVVSFGERNPPIVSTLGTTLCSGEQVPQLLFCLVYTTKYCIELYRTLVFTTSRGHVMRMMSVLCTAVYHTLYIIRGIRTSRLQTDVAAVLSVCANYAEATVQKRFFFV